MLLLRSKMREEMVFSPLMQPPSSSCRNSAIFPFRIELEDPCNIHRVNNEEEMDDKVKDNIVQGKEKC